MHRGALRVVEGVGRMLMDLLYGGGTLIASAAFAGYCVHRHTEENRQLGRVRRWGTDTTPPRTMAAIAEDRHR